MVENRTVNFQVAFGAVKHFGRNLYTSNPPAIGELVANAWDAYATICEVYYNSSKNSMIICDNGIGMTDEEFEKRYAVSGMDKNCNIRIPENMPERPYMGRKGIGKFSVFSLGESYYIYTKSTGEDKWKKAHLTFNELMVNSSKIPIEIEYIDNLDELKQDYSDCYLDQDSGTIIVIPEMKRRFTGKTLESLTSILPRRFSVNISGKYNFSLKLNGDSIDLTKHFYDDSVEFVYYFGYSSEEIKRRFSTIDNEEFLHEIDNEYFTTHGVRGWVGSVKETTALKIGEELNSVGVIVYINGKLATDDILKSSQNSTMANLYIVGEVEADFLQNEQEDPVLSSREGLNMELENVKLLQAEIDKVRKKAVSDWSELRSKRKDESQDYLVEIFQDESYSEMYNNLEEYEKTKFKKYTQKLFDRPKSEEIGLKKFYVPFVFSIINSESIGEIQVESTDEITETLDKFVKLFEKSEINAALRIKENFQDRLNVIDNLEKSIDEKAIESVFERHLANNPWLLNVFWDSRNNKILTQQKYSAMIDENKVNGRTDIIIEAGDEPYPIIIEVKRESSTAYSTPTVESIIAQISKYRRLIKESLIDINPQQYGSVSLYNIKAYMVLGRKANRKLNPDDRDELNRNKIEILTYEGMIENAKNIYAKELIVDIND
ncbi:ATP-binding protein [Lactococcus lactis]|uniref:ATP-binding protein n=1 Tax=Lactococcus lactis TaxID=1358 RepID=UPI00210EAEBF|nr:ATP-binding protein [Lactococcus lactis]MCQ4972443.1 ATP-binding protein [Lactococcus lactis]MCQ4998249.1 ATP-binding protein [Lactococcus lactis]